MKARELCAIGAVLLLSACMAACGGNSTTAGVTVTPATPTVPLQGIEPFTATVSGVSATTTSWQLCPDVPLVNSTTHPTNNCTPAVAPNPVSACALPAVTGTPLTGYGTVNSAGLYAAPAVMPTTGATFFVVATSCVDTTAFAVATVTLSSGVSIQVLPPSVTILTGEHFQFTGTVTGAANTAILWTLPTAANCNNCGTLSPTGLYTAPASPVGSVTITATSAADPTQSATAVVTVASQVAPQISATTPTTVETVAQGSAQQDVYVTGSNFFATSTVLVGGNPVPIVFLTGSLLRATVPANLLSAAGSFPIRVQEQGGGLDVSPAFDLTVAPVRPALVSASAASVTQSAANASINLTGGFFSPAATTVQFNGQAHAVSFTSSRQLNLALTAADVGAPGLYPIVAQNSTVAAESALNLAVTPLPASIANSPGSSAAVGNNPSAVAIDYVDELAVVVNTGSNSVSMVNLITKTASAPISVGNAPTGVAVDDLLPDPVALVVNSTDRTVTAIDLKTLSTTTVSVALPAGATPANPISVGINPMTPQPVPGVVPVKHRALVAYQSSNEASILDVSVAGGTPTLSIVQQVGGSFSSYLTGPNPSVAIDPGLNWAVVTPGGQGTFNIVDLGRDPALGDVGRAPQVIGSLSISGTEQGVGINSETHQALLTDPNAGIGGDTNAGLSSFDLLDESLNTIQFQNNGVPLISNSNFVAAAANPLTNVGIAVQEVNSAKNAVVVDLQSGNVLQYVTLGFAAQAVAVDPIGDQAVIVDPADNEVQFLSIGPALNPVQILEMNPSVTDAFPSGSPASLPVTITGGGFITGVTPSQVLLDGTALPGADVNVVSAREIQVTIPASNPIPGSNLTSAQRHIVQVKNPAGGPISNVAPLTVIQPIPVGHSPAGVAVDADRDLAAVTNSGDNTVSLVALSPATPVGQNQNPAGTVGTSPFGLPIGVGTNPQGIAILPRLGLALVANNASNTASVVDITQTNPTYKISLCSFCSGPLGVSMDQDAGDVSSGFAALTSINSNSPLTVGVLSYVPIQTPPPTTAIAIPAPNNVDPNPVAVAIEPEIDPSEPSLGGYAAVATASQNSSAEFLTMTLAGGGGSVIDRASGLQLPTGIIFDPLNQQFLVTDSLENQLDIIDPNTFLSTSVRTGINPTSLDYNFQASTLVTVNGVSRSMSVLDYVCPPALNGGPSACGAAAPQVREVLGFGGSMLPPTSSIQIAPNTMAIDPKLDVAVLADPDNNQILVIPLP